MSPEANTTVVVLLWLAGEVVLSLDYYQLRLGEIRCTEKETL